MNEINAKVYKTLNNILVDLFNDILSIEENSLRRDEFSDLSIRDFHIIEQIIKLGRTNMSALAKVVRVTKGTLTVAIDQLVRKGYVKRDRKSTDRRIVEVWPTEKAIAADVNHQKFHKDMIDAVLDILDSNELEVLESAFSKLNGYLQSNYDILDAK
jgi:DNA-binding MarR family transcriptional regulator